MKNLDNFDKLELKNEKFFHTTIFWKPEADLIVKSGRDGIKTKIIPIIEIENSVMKNIPDDQFETLTKTYSKYIKVFREKVECFKLG